MTAALAAQAPAKSGHDYDYDYDHAVAAALTAFGSGDYWKARELFERAHVLKPNARTLRALGMTAVELKRYTQARQELENSQQDTRDPLTPAQQAEVSNMLKWMHGALASVQLRVEPAQAQVFIDGQLASGSQLLEPGQHSLRVTADGYRPVEQALSLDAGNQRVLALFLTRLELKPQLAETAQPAAGSATQGGVQFVQPGSPRPHSDSKPLVERWWFWTAVGVVVVGGAVTAIALASSKKYSVTEPAWPRVEVLTAGPSTAGPTWR
jgi:tetratricopeptide (TPR) repeat protein